MLPEGWEVKTVTQACDILDNQRIPLNDEERQTMKGHIPYYGANAIVDYIDSYLFDEDLILLAEDGGNFDDYENRQIAYKITGKSWVNNHAHIVRPKKKFDFDFIFYSLQHKNITSFIRGGTRSKLNQSDLKAVELLAPISYSEQQKIASILSTLDRTIETTQKLIDKEKMIKNGLMADLLTHGIDEQGGIRSPHTHMYVDSPLGMIPEGWEVKLLSDFFKLKSGDTKPIDTSSQGLYGVYGGNGITGYSNYYNNDATTLVIGRVGEYCGCVYKVDKCWITDNALLIDKKILSFDTNYMFFLLTFLNLNQYKSETGQPLLNQTIIGKVIVPYVPKQEQQRIATILSAQDRKIETEETNLAKLRNLKKGLMGDLLSGDVRVK